MTSAQALAMLLRRERLFAVDVDGVLVVALDSRPTFANYSRERITACRIASADDRRFEVVYVNSRIHDILTSFAQSMSRKAVLETGIPRGARPYSITLSSVTRAQALQVLSHVAHLAHGEDGDALVFAAASAQP